jgi:hypothetical protein
MPRSAEDPAEGSVGAGAEPRGEGAAAGPPSAPAVYGPLVVERHRKDDGRALILFSRREPE